MTTSAVIEGKSRADARLEELVPVAGDEGQELVAALAEVGFEQLSAARRTGELRLDLRCQIEDVVATAVILPHAPGGKAFVRTRLFDIGYLSEEGANPSRPVLAAVRRLGKVLERAAVARPVVALLADPDARVAGRGMQALRESAPAGDDIHFEAVEALAAFDVTRCNRRPDVAPRQLGIGALIVVQGDELVVHRARGRVVDGDGVHTTRNVQRRARIWQDGAWQHLRMVARCTDCKVRHECAGVFEERAPDPMPAAALAERLRTSDLARAGRRVLGTAVFQSFIQSMAADVDADDSAPQTSPALVVVEAAQLTDRQGRARLAKAMSAAGADAHILVVGRGPLALVGAPAEADGSAVSQVHDPLHIRPAEVARVARSLGGTLLALQDYRLAGRDGADPWWLLYRQRGHGRPLPVLQHITMVANRRCVTVCRYCDLPLRMKDSMTLREALAAIEETAVLGAVALEFFGGEVTLRGDLFSILAFAQRLGVQTFVTTTGVGLDDAELDRMVAAGIKDLSISVDAPSAEVHDDLKGREGMFAAATRAAKELKARGTDWVSFNSVVTRFNYQLLPGVVELAGELGLDGSTFFFCQPLAEIGNETPLLNEEEVSQLVNDILPRCREIAARVNVQLGVRPAIDLEACSHEQVAARVGSGTYCRIFETDEPCSIAKRIVAIHPGGDVRLCNQPVFQFKPDPVVGNLREMHLGEVLLSERAACFRREAGRLPDCRFCTFDHPLPTGGDEGKHT